jgi:hypothetical protein
MTQLKTTKAQNGPRQSDQRHKTTQGTTQPHAQKDQSHRMNQIFKKNLKFIFADF